MSDNFWHTQDNPGSRSFRFREARRRRLEAQNSPVNAWPIEDRDQPDLTLSAGDMAGHSMFGTMVFLVVGLGVIFSGTIVALLIAAWLA